jgi:NAD(P)-dependent dehydrogenase (short-subunit alcohol dehydrogenase family)
VSRTGTRTLAALLVGAVLGAATAAGNALLLYTGHGFLRAAGLLIASTILAVAAGVWAGAPEPEDAHTPVRSRSRWVTLIIALLMGGAFTVAWGTREPLQNLALGGALAVLFVVALPAYAAGALLAALHARERQDLPAHGSGSVAAAATAGAAFGVLISTSVLIQNLEPYGIYYLAAGLLTLMAMMEWSSTGQPHTRIADMRDHVAIITGAGKAGQLGFAIARRFLSAGASVVVTGHGDDIERTAAELGSSDRVAAVRADLTDEAQVLAVLQSARDRFGRLDSVINTAGGLTLIKPISETSSAEWEREIRRNASTALLMSRAALPLLRETRGAIVNFASPAGSRAVANMGAYSAAKAAVIALTRALALEEKRHGVRVNAIAPGMMDTEQNMQSAADDAEFVRRDDVAGVALFLAGPESRGITGETIHVTATARD